eukprot:283231_1
MLDCSIIKCMNDLNLISSTDYFYPLVDDPYLQGRIGAANVMSDIYSLGISHIDNVLMILAASSNITDKTHRDIITSQMMKGFIDTCRLGDTQVTGGHSVKNPWPIIGGCAQTVVSDTQYISPYNGRCGDYLVLTKPLGTQVAVNIAEWKALKHDKYKQVVSQGIMGDSSMDRMINIAKGSMVKLNRNAAMLMMNDRYKKYVNGATDVTGFGILGHAQNLSFHQHVNTNTKDKALQLHIDRLPIIKYSDVMDDLFDGMFKLKQGLSAETSGGLLIMISDKDAALDFIDELEELDGWPAWIVGNVRESLHVDHMTMNDAAIIDEDFDFVGVW